MGVHEAVVEQGLAAKRKGPKRQGLIPVIDRKLQNWGEWTLRNEDSGAGEAAGVSMLGKLIDGQGVLIRSTDPSAGSMPDEVFDVGRAVERLPVKLQQVVEAQYLDLTATHQQRAESCGCAYKTFYRRLAEAHQRILFSMKAPSQSGS